MQPSPPSISRTFPSSQTETLSPLNSVWTGQDSFQDRAHSGGNTGAGGGGCSRVRVRGGRAPRREGGGDPCCFQCGRGVEANLWAQERGASSKSVYSGDRPRRQPEKGQHPSASLSSLPPLQRSGLCVRFPSAPSVRRPLSVAQTSLSVSPLGATAGPGACWSGSRISIRSCPACQEPAVWWGHQHADPWAPSWM